MPSRTFMRIGSRQAELDEAVIEERRTGLETDRHRGAVDLHHDVVGEEGDEVQEHQPLDRIRQIGPLIWMRQREEAGRRRSPAAPRPSSAPRNVRQNASGPRSFMARANL